MVECVGVNHLLNYFGFNNAFYSLNTSNVLIFIINI